MKESCIAKAVIASIEPDGWEVWQEVVLPNGKRADIVAKNGSVVWIIETKVCLSLDLVEQALNRKWYAHLTSIAYPLGKKRFPHIENIIQSQGVGIYQLNYVQRTNMYENLHFPNHKPKFNRKAIVGWTKILNDSNKALVEAGTNQGGYWTPFRQTCLEAVKFVETNPGCCMKDLIEAIKHHYASNSTARTVFAKRITEGVVPGLRVVREGRFLRVYKEPTP